jgi:hypothetical protein
VLKAFLAGLNFCATPALKRFLRQMQLNGRKLLVKSGRSKGLTRSSASLTYLNGGIFKFSADHSRNPAFPKRRKIYITMVAKKALKEGKWGGCLNGTYGVT